MNLELLKGSLNPLNIFKWLRFKVEYRRLHPDELTNIGLLVFCGFQGQGKTLSAVQYLIKLSFQYPKAIICTNTTINGLNPASVVVDYEGLDSLKNIENGEYGVVYFIDEIHLEMNSLESKNIDIDIMIEISQQRKQRKHIVGTSQKFMRIAKPTREQMQYVVDCNNYFGFLQINHLFYAPECTEVDGVLKCPRGKHFFWFHRPELYGAYDTYKKMKRYRKEWQGRPRIDLK